MGNTQLQKDIIAGVSAKEIKAKWQNELNTYKEMRKKYLLYED